LKFIFLVTVALLLVSCASTSRQTDTILKSKRDFPDSAKVTDVPFIKQTKDHCGPATLAMAMEKAGHPVSTDELAAQTFTPGQAGTFQTNMLSASRRQGMMAISITDVESLLKEIAAGQPVIVFQNVALSILPKWHYAVAIGYDLKVPELTLHSGERKNDKMDLRDFERTWLLGKYWGIVILKPGEIAPAASELAHASAAAGLEQAGMLPQAELAYLAILNKWPNSLLAYIGLGNVKYQENKFADSVKYLEIATQKHPESAIAWHNLAEAYGANKNLKKAKVSAEKAIQLGPDYRENLKSWL
jgi:hypothetical protein